MTDAELIDASRRGEREAFGRLVERYQKLVCAVSYGATGDRALSEDVAQETFLAAWRQLGELAAPSKVRPWLCAIARNLGLRARRDVARVATDDEAPELPVDGPSPFDAVVEAEATWIVRDTLQRVPETYREVLVLYYQYDRSIEEVARALGISESAALQRLSRGRKYLADGVTDLVERSITESRPRKALPALVVAALPARTPRVEVMDNPTHGGWNMLKLGLIAGAIAATGGTTAYVVHASRQGAEEKSEAAPAVVARAADRPAAAPAQARRASRPDAPALPTRMAASPMIDADDPPQADIDQATIDRLKLHDGPSRGPAAAPVTIVVYTDFMCSFCGNVLGTIDDLWDEYPGKLKLVIKQFPVHDEARLAAEAALAAQDQGKFWELHDLMMANQDDLSRDALVAHARQAGLEVGSFTRALDQRTYRGAVEADMAAGQEIEVRGTPAFFINGKRFTGARPIEQFRAGIDAALAELR
ncbi:MAG TPA: sigma-70 family RNA polymerase sigma factor [Kofleriaceae bacterium]|nr:sigma-70 family RNA polymerase sigma factor [Kofleriaceae bacterium]